MKHKIDEQVCEVCGSTEDTSHYVHLTVLLNQPRMFVEINNTMICQSCDDFMMEGHLLFWNGNTKKEHSKVWFNEFNLKMCRGVKS